MKISSIFTAGNEFEEDLEILEEAALQVYHSFFSHYNILQPVIALQLFDCYGRKSLVRILQ